MNEQPISQAGSALVWRTVQLTGVKLVYFLRLLILARLLAPDHFGLLAIAVTAIGFFLRITNLGMIPALVQEQNVDDKHYDAAWTMGIIRALAVSTVVIAAAPLIATIFAEPRATEIIQVLALRPTLDSLVSIRVANLERMLQFRPLAILKLIEALTNTIISIALASTFGVWALVAGVLAGSLMSVLLSYILAPHRPRLSFDMAAIRPLIRFGRWIFVNSLIAMAGSSVLRIAISRQLGAAELGIYFLAAQVAFLPAEIASGVVGSVAFPLISRIQSNLHQIARAFRTMLVGMSALLYPVSALIIALAPTFVEEVLGSKWEGTEPVIRILSLATMIGLFGEAVVPILKGVGQPYKVTIIELIQSFLLITLVWELANRYGIVGAALAWLPAIIVSQFISAIFIKQILDKPFAGLKGPILAIIAATGAGAIVAFGIVQIIPGLIGFGAAIIIALCVTGALLWASERRYSLGFVRDFTLMFPQIADLLGFKYTSAEG